MTSPVVGGARRRWERLPEGGSALQPVGRETRHVSRDARRRRGAGEGAGRGAWAVLALSAPCRPSAAAAPINGRSGGGSRGARVSSARAVTLSSHVSQSLGPRVQATVPACRAFLGRLTARVFLSFPEREPLTRGTGRTGVQTPTGCAGREAVGGPSPGRTD